MKRIYLSGPMTGKPDLNRPAFKRYADIVRAMGYEVVNPHDVPATKYGGGLVEGEPSYDDYLLSDIVSLVKCDGILMLPGWQESKGARVELEIAMVLGHSFFRTLDELVDVEWHDQLPRVYNTKIVSTAFGPLESVGLESVA